ncbi:MAG: DUF2330 domain-containing protein [Candidatus Hydrogenedentes bacterium]|nr:DUF2330 domain-containing protein [Candidatus Hydrogenedentota bacterium]
MGIGMRACGAILQIFTTLAVVTGCVGLSVSASADGTFANERLQKKIPAIPWQRALITYKDGVEHLMVQSAVDADGATLGWIIPVPRVPTDIAKGSVGALQILSMRLQPQIIDVGSKLAGRHAYYRLFAIICSAWAISVVAGSPTWKKLLRSIPVLGGLIVLLWLYTALSSPRGETKSAVAGSTRGRIASSVAVEETARIGNYDVATLKAEKAEDLRAWLLDNGFSELPGNGDEIVQQYISEGWHFVVAKLNREGEGIAVPHPLAITFPAERAVYPMRLTALSASDVYLELYVVGDGMASVEPLTGEYCDEVLYDNSMGFHFGHDSGGFDPSSRGNPVLDRLLWKGATITKLSGKVRPDEMSSDYFPQFTPRAPYRQTLYTRGAARQFAWIWFYRVWSASVFVGVLLAYLLLNYWRSRKWVPALIIGTVGVPLAGVSGVEAYRQLPLTEVVARYPIAVYFLDDSTDVIRAIADAHYGFRDTPPERIADTYRMFFNSIHVPNPFTGARIALDDAPGDITIEQDGAAVVVQTYERSGAPARTMRFPDVSPTPISVTNPDVNGTVHPDDLDAVEKGIRLWRDIPFTLDRDHILAAYTCQRNPNRFLPLLRDELRSLIERNSRNSELIEFEAGILGLMTRIAPPLDVTNGAAMQKFLDVVSAFQPQKGAPSP